MEKIFGVSVIVNNKGLKYRGQLYCTEVQTQEMFNQTFYHFYMKDEIIATFSSINATYDSDLRQLTLKGTEGL